MWARSATAPHRVVSQAKALLMAGDGVANSRIATALGISRPTVLDWRARFRSEGLDSVGAVRPGRGRKPEITADQVQAIVHSTSHETPPGATHWSCRSMAKGGRREPLHRAAHLGRARRPSAEQCPDRAQERHDAVRWCRLGSTDSAEEPEIVVARAIVRQQ